MLWPGGIRLALGAAVVGSAFAAGWSSNGWRLEAQAAQRIERARAAQEASNATIIQAYRTELERIRNRAPRRVLWCPDVPAATGGIVDPAAPGVRPDAGLDLGPVLAECRAYVAQLDALIQSVRGKQ